MRQLAALASNPASRTIAGEAANAVVATKTAANGRMT
jgi:hypothetical protein